jgi:DNA modification methylase
MCSLMDIDLKKLDAENKRFKKLQNKLSIALWKDLNKAKQIRKEMDHIIKNGIWRKYEL